MEYIKITFTEVDNEAQEKLIGLLSGYNFEGFEQLDNQLFAYIENDLFDDDDVRAILREYAHEKERLPKINWNQKWETNFEPIVVKNKVSIRADFHEPLDETPHEIIITPKMSFGTGHHATTQLMLEQMSKIDFKNKRVFDYGTGTGVLSIYAEQLGAAEIIANDIDPWSEENAKENTQRNVCKKIDVRLGGIEVVPENKFDVILANINLGVLRLSMKDLFEKLNKGAGMLVISGVLDQNKEDILKIINMYTDIYEVFTKDKWLCISANI